MLKTANVFSKAYKAGKKSRAAGKLLKEQKKSSIARPELEEELHKVKSKANKDLGDNVAKALGGTVIGGYALNKVHKKLKQSKEEAMNAFGHRGADYAGIHY